MEVITKAREPQLPPHIDLNVPKTLNAVLDPKFKLAFLKLEEKKLDYELKEKELDKAHELEQRRLQNIEKDQNSQRLKSTLTYIISFVIFGFILIPCLIILTDPKNSDKNQEWARTTITSITLGLVTFFFGKQTGSSSNSG